MSVPVRSAVMNPNTLPKSSGARSGALSAESRSDSAAAPSASRPAQGSATVRFTVRSANSRSNLGLRTASLRSARHAFQEEAGRMEREEIKGVSAGPQPYIPAGNRTDGDRGRGPNRVKFTPDAKVTADTGATQSSTASDAKPRFSTDDTDAPGKACSPLGSARGRTEWRKESMQSRSKSLDWRGRVDDGGRAGIQNLSTGAAARRAESLERREVENSSLDRKASYKDYGEAGSVSSHIQAYSAVRGSEKALPTLGEGVTGTSSLRLNRVVSTLDRAGGERSLPLRLRPQDSLKSPVEGRPPWRQLSQEDSGLGGSKSNEVTGNQTILDRIERLYGMSGSDDAKAKRHSAPVGDWLDNLPSDLTPGQRKLSSDIGSPSYTLHSPRSPTSHNVEKGGTFPRRFSPGDDNFSRRDTLPSLSTSVAPVASRYRERSIERKTLPPEVGLYTKSLDRARSRLSATAQLKHLRETETPSKEFSKETVCSHLKSSGVVKESSLKEEQSKVTMDKDVAGWKAKESVTANRGDESRCKFGKSDCLDKLSRTKDSQETLAMASKTSESNVGKIPKKEYSSDKGFAIPPNAQASPTKQSINSTVDEDVFDTRVKSVNGPIGKQDAKKGQSNNPSMDSVRNTIHKFEALAQKTRTAPQFLKSRRFFSVPEHPKDRGGLKKSESDHALARRTQESMRGNPHDKAWTMRSISVDEIGLNQDSSDKFEMGLKGGIQKPSSKGTDPKSHGSKDVDETDSRALFVIRNTVTVQDCVKRSSKPEHTLFPYHQNNHNNNSNRRAVFEQNDLETPGSFSKVSDASEDDADKTPTNSPVSLPLFPSFNGYDPTPFKPPTPTNSDIHPPSDADSEPPTPTNSVHSTRGPLLIRHGPPGLTSCPPLDRLTLLDKGGGSGPFSPSVARWSSDEEEDEEEDDDDDDGTQRDSDSDSGESSVTITSNMSRRSFSVSLAELCNFGGVDYSPLDDSEDDADDWPSGRSASLSSDISAVSCVTLLDNEELDSLLQDVRNLGDDALQNYDDVQVVVLHKEVGTGLGFTVAGGIDQNKPVTVHKVFSHGVAGQEGSIQEGDLVLSINGTTLQNSGHWEALRTLRKARGRGMAVVVLQRARVGHPPQKRTNPEKGTLITDVGESGRRLRVTLKKRSSDLGFSLEGGVGSSQGDRPLIVQKLFQGGPVEDVRPGDEILEIEGHSMTGLMRLEAWQLIKKLPIGTVELLLRRPSKPH
ncbi:uncharacterized protein si:dkey-92i15.4 [Alosa sapidissima]|uniref:uncharacterized protein si:dkey-92i15.4 n=1 Tax=Alosa sapidissima TaxID=34773 RepID=UPI001C0A5393|nr:uncharacterized protein si:dkey-92i15.4 [Alosa sapidissima]XP_041961598.1 uncharacterized protein si:dkey-92i15.4 [Alosa sapidissima]XP_041961599.1 uncharacterized protein si:dkey-92i15.4 [Alosa sapidissima]